MKYLLQMDIESNLSPESLVEEITLALDFAAINHTTRTVYSLDSDNHYKLVYHAKPKTN